MKMDSIVAAILFAAALLTGSLGAVLAQDVTNTTNTATNTTGLPSMGGAVTELT